VGRRRDGAGEPTAAGGPQFADPAVPGLQLLTLGAALDDGTLLIADTEQDGVVRGLRLRRATDDPVVEATDIYRRRPWPELPTGELDGVSGGDGGPSGELGQPVEDRAGAVLGGQLGGQRGRPGGVVRVGGDGVQGGRQPVGG